MRKFSRVVVGIACLTACSGAVVSPRDVVTYESRAVNGAVVPASFRVASGDTLRIISERLVFGPDDEARISSAAAVWIGDRHDWCRVVSHPCQG